MDRPTPAENLETILRELNRLIARAAHLEQVLMRPSVVLRPNLSRAQITIDEIIQVAHNLGMEPEKVATAHAELATPLWEATFDNITATANTPAEALRLFDQMWWEARGPL